MKKLMPKLKGFTIIEVIIVLVIGAVIMLAVFLVIPQLQVNARNNQRRNDIQRVLVAARQYYTTNTFRDYNEAGGGGGIEASSIISCQIRTTRLGQGLSYLPKYLVPILTSLPITVSSSLLLR